MTCRILTVVMLAVALALCSSPVATATFPGANGRIAFNSYGSGNRQSPPSLTEAIQDVQPDGSGGRQLIVCTQSPGLPDAGNCSLRTSQGAAFGEPSYSRDGRRIVFFGAFKIGVMRADGSGMRLYGTPGNPSEPAFSPDGKRVVFTDRTVGKDAVADLYVLNLGTSRVRRLTRGEHPAWSSRNRIAYVSRSGNIRSIRPDGKGSRMLVRNGREPDWSPRGKQIVFTRLGRRNAASVHILHTRTMRTRPLRGTSDDPSSPVWSPDGRLIAYSGGPGSIAMIRTDGRRNRVLVEARTSDSGSTRFHSPTWQPVRRGAR